MAPDVHDAPIMEAIGERRAQIDDRLSTAVAAGDPPDLYAATRHILTAGGKRLRPAVTLLVGEAVVGADPATVSYESFPTIDGQQVDLMAAATAIEVIQSFTLIHDDIMDDDAMRRGVEAVHEAFDTELAILAGDTLYAKAFELLTDSGARPDRVVAAVDLLAATCVEICEGQAMDIAFESRPQVSTDEYLLMIERKTAVLYATAAAVGAILVGADEEVVDAVYEYGLESGKAFQIQDDVLDLTTPSAVLGKRRGSDLIERKETLITVHARDRGVDVDAIFAAVDGDAEVDMDDAVQQLDAADSIAFAARKARSLTQAAVDRLTVVDESPARRLLVDLAEYLITRGY
jgi:geranylgeranyl diphosphate synthase type I